MSICNYCTFQRIKERAQQSGQHAVASSRTADFGLGGKRVYILPKGIRLSQIPDGELEKYSNGTWFMEIPDHCTCD